MSIELKKAITEWLFENSNEFQINNRCTQQFREYIYNSKGNYLIGGQKVLQFIDMQIKLIEL